MGLVDYILRLPNQQAKVTHKYDEEFAVATIRRHCIKLYKFFTATLHFAVY